MFLLSDYCYTCAIFWSLKNFEKRIEGFILSHLAKRMAIKGMDTPPSEITISSWKYLGLGGGGGGVATPKGDSSSERACSFI